MIRACLRLIFIQVTNCGRLRLMDYLQIYRIFGPKTADVDKGREREKGHWQMERRGNDWLGWRWQLDGGESWKQSLQRESVWCLTTWSYTEPKTNDFITSDLANGLTLPQQVHTQGLMMSLSVLIPQGWVWLLACEAALSQKTCVCVDCQGRGGDVICFNLICMYQQFRPWKARFVESSFPVCFCLPVYGYFCPSVWLTGLSVPLCGTNTSPLNGRCSVRSQW